MPDNDLLRRYLDAGVAFTQMTRQKAEAIVKDLVRSGEVSREQATARVEDLLERSRQNTEAVLSLVRKEIDDRLSQLNLVTREDLAAVAGRFGITLPGAATKAPARPASAAKKATPAKKTTAKKTTTKAAGPTRKATTARKATKKA